MLRPPALAYFVSGRTEGQCRHTRPQIRTGTEVSPTPIALACQDMADTKSGTPTIFPAGEGGVMATTQSSPAHTAVGYLLEGTLLEACSCGVLCPCWIGDDPDGGQCFAFNAYHFDKGR